MRKLAPNKLYSSASMAGFTLVELMVVVAIIGILAAVAGPRVQAFRARGVQSEAKANLNSIYLAQSAFQDANDTFFPGEGEAVACATGKDCGANFAFRQLAGSKYDYTVNGDSGRWAAHAVSRQKILNNKQDVWRINAPKVLCAAYDAVLNKDKQNGCDGAEAVGTLTLTDDDSAQ